MESNNKIALVTGGSRGLGKDMVLKLAESGCDIVLTYHINKTEADKVVNDIIAMGRKAVAMPLDVGHISSLTAFRAELDEALIAMSGTPHFDYLINNAGTGLSKGINETTEDEFDSLLNVHFKGVYFLTQQLLSMINDGGGIINVSSGLTRFSFPGSSAYACMKGAVEVFTRYLAKELGQRRINANTLAPGAIATDFAGGSNRDNVEKRAIISSLTALGRVGEPNDIGGVVAFLCSDQAKWINGQRLEVSGGMLV